MTADVAIGVLILAACSAVPFMLGFFAGAATKEVPRLRLWRALFDLATDLGDSGRVGEAAGVLEAMIVLENDDESPVVLRLREWAHRYRQRAEAP